MIDFPFASALPTSLNLSHVWTHPALQGPCDLMAVRDTTARLYPAACWEGRRPLRHDGICALPPQHFDDLTTVCVITRLWKSRSDLSRPQDSHSLRHGVEGTLICHHLSGAPPLLLHRPAMLGCPCGALEPLKGGWLCQHPGRGRHARPRRARQHPCCRGRTQAAGRYRSPFARKTQAMRAVVCAWATPARLFPRRTMRS